MAKLEQRAENIVFGLDIGTRSVVGTVGYMKSGKFHVMAQRVQMHETRAMLDGQIHDIGKVSATVENVRSELEEATGIHLTDVCIAAAGRVLRTIQASFEYEYPNEHEITNEDIYNLNSKAVEKAYRDFLSQNDTGMKFYLVGHSVVHYYLNGYQIANLEGHKAKNVSVDVIATFLPDDVVDGLYKACERAGLKVVNLTLEPIAAIMIAIPEKFRMLNLALIDVGAGTSDICITDDGTITAYGMIPVAGDHITEIIAKHCLVDFNMADRIKIDLSSNDSTAYTDIMGLEKTITAKETESLISTEVDLMAQQAAECIKKINGDKPVSAVFIVGGGGCVPGYTQAVAKYMGIAKERVAIRGSEVMTDIDFMEGSGAMQNSLMVTPVGICMSFYENSNNFIFVSFNGEQIKIYDNGKLAIVDAAMQAAFPNSDLFPKKGNELRFTVNGINRVARGEPGEAAVITLNGENADIHSRIHANDIISIIPSTAGLPAHERVEALPEYKNFFHIIVNDKPVDMPGFVIVNGAPGSPFYEISDGDAITVADHNTIEQIAQMLDIPISPECEIRVNNEAAYVRTDVYDNFKVIINDSGAFGNNNGSPVYAAGSDADSTWNEENINEENINEEASFSGESKPKNILIHDIKVTVNRKTVVMHGKNEYIFVDIFDYIDFDLNDPKGRAIVTLLNGKSPDYMHHIEDGDIIEIYWK